jgi:predicted GNAT superfamily acetyltransferase
MPKSQLTSPESWFIRDITVEDYPAILQMNEASVHYLSPLDRLRLEMLHQQARYHKVIEIENTLAAFMLAFDRDAKYDSPNYLWFRDRYSSFLYIDRVVVHEDFRRRGLADEFYCDLQVYALQHRYAYLTCEIDSQPPNLGSIRFHEKHQFVEVGTQWLYNGAKQVSLRERRLAKPSDN